MAWCAFANAPYLPAGIRQFHFNAWKDPNGTLASNPAGLKLAGLSNVTLDPKYTYFGAAHFPLLTYCSSTAAPSYAPRLQLRQLMHDAGALPCLLVPCCRARLSGNPDNLAGSQILSQQSG